MILGIDASNIRGGGGVTHLVELLNAKISQKNFSKIIIWANKETLKKIADSSHIKKINPSLLNKSLPYRMFWQAFLLSLSVKKQQCDILFIPGGSFITSFRPIVTMSQNLLPFEVKELLRFGWSLKTLKLLVLRLVQASSFKRANGVIFLTKYAKTIVEQTTKSSYKKTSVISHGLDKRFFSEPKIQKPIIEYSTENPLRILYVSIIDVYKHQWHVVEAVAALRKEGYPVCLDLVGPSYPPALNRLQAAINNLDPKEKYLKYLGPVSYNQLHDYYATSDVFVFASSCENLPNILLEAMASGLPIACSNKGTMPEVLGEAGIYFAPESPKSIANALRKLIASSELRYEKACMSYEEAKQYSWERCASETFSFLAEVAKTKAV